MPYDYKYLVNYPNDLKNLSILNSTNRDLIKEGLNVQRLINYSVSHVEDISFDFLSELKKKIPDIVYIYSQNSAVSFLNLIKK